MEAFKLKYDDEKFKVKLKEAGTFEQALKASVKRYSVRFTSNMKRYAPVRTGAMKGGYYHVEEQDGNTLRAMTANTARRRVGKGAPFPYWWVVEETGWRIPNRIHSGIARKNPRRTRYKATNKAQMAFETEMKKWGDKVLRPRA